MAEPFNAWQCRGCQRIEAPQPCIGVCEDRRVELVDAGAYRTALERAETAERHADALHSFVAQMTRLRPSEGHWQDSFEALQHRARRLLAELES